MTENGAFKKQVRAHAARHGENYTTALRRLSRARASSEAAPGVSIEPHYRFLPPDAIEYVDAQGRRLLDVPEYGSPFAWGYSGDGPLTSADALLIDATGSTDPHLGIAFVTDNLAWWEQLAHKSFVLTVAEVRAWRRENEARVREEAAGPSASDARTLANDMLAWLAGPPRRPWWEEYRERHGRPRAMDIAATMIGQALEIIAASGPSSLTTSVPISPKQGLVLAVYSEAQAVRRGYGRTSALADYTRRAIRAGIPQREIDAALVAAGRQHEGAAVA